MNRAGRSSREKVLAILEHRNTEGVAFWTGNPHDDTYALYLERIGGAAREDLFAFLGDDCRWFPSDPATGAPKAGHSSIRTSARPGAASRSRAALRCASPRPRWSATPGRTRRTWISPAS